MLFNPQKSIKILFFSLLLIAIIIVAGCARPETFAGKAFETTSACLDPSACGYATTDDLSKVWTNISFLGGYIDYLDYNLDSVKYDYPYKILELQSNVSMLKKFLNITNNTTRSFSFNSLIKNEISELRSEVYSSLFYNLDQVKSQIFTPVLVVAGSPTESEAIDLCASAGYNGCVAGIFVKTTEYFSSKDKKCTGKQLVEKETVMRPCDSVPAAPTGCITSPTLLVGGEPEVGDKRITESLQSVLCLK